MGGRLQLASESQGAHCSWLKATVVAGRKSAEEPPTMA